jgi:5-(aminomethyl)-3-furanmethanol phosphate kinase
MRLDAVLKVGGSLSRGDSLESLCSEIGRLGRQYRLLVVPGGGEFADQVRTAYRRFTLDETAAHYMALLAMDQFGYLLNRLIEGSHLSADLLSACQAAGSARAAVLLPSTMVIQTDPLPHSWQVTSDTIAAWIASRSDCRQLVLLKNVDGLFAAGAAMDSSDGFIAEISVQQLMAHSGGVDEYLAQYLASVSLETWIINGSHPSRLAELLSSGYTAGTRILRS